MMCWRRGVWVRRLRCGDLVSMTDWVVVVVAGSSGLVLFGAFVDLFRS